jgi:arsenate reductase
MSKKKRALFLCTGNSARSQMAEGLVNHYLGDRWCAYSAGTAPTGFVHPLAVAAMGELGIDVTSHHSKSVHEFTHTCFDAVVTVCDAAAEDCPLWLGSGNAKHLGFPDPAAASGDEAERLAVFRAVRDNLRRTVLAHLERVERQVCAEVGR